MEEKGTFKRIDKSDKRMYGPRGLLVCGYPLEERDVFLELVIKTLGKISVIFGVNRDVENILGEIFKHEHKTGLNDPSDLPRAVIMSGLSQNELHSLMGAYREAGFISQIWATLTPISEGWTLKALLIELLAEAKAVRKK
jgi:hypothetical protein